MDFLKDKDKLTLVGYAAIALAYSALFYAKYKSMQKH